MHGNQGPMEQRVTYDYCFNTDRLVIVNYMECPIEGCSRWCRTNRAMCDVHDGQYRRAVARGAPFQPLPGRHPNPQMDGHARLINAALDCWDEVDHGYHTPCHEYTGDCDGGPQGYARLQLPGGPKIRLARTLGTRDHGAVPGHYGWLMDHLCKNPKCIRSDHLVLTDRGGNAKTAVRLTEEGVLAVAGVFICAPGGFPQKFERVAQAMPDVARPDLMNVVTRRTAGTRLPQWLAEAMTRALHESLGLGSLGL